MSARYVNGTVISVHIRLLSTVHKLKYVHNYFNKQRQCRSDINAAHIHQVMHF